MQFTCFTATSVVRPADDESYGPKPRWKRCDRSGEYVGLVLKGTKTSDLPVVRASKIELVINRKTVRSLGLEIPMSLQMRVDEMIE